MTFLSPTQKFWLQAGGALFALGVALWCFRDMPGREMAETVARYAVSSHERVLARQVAGLMARAHHPCCARPASDRQVLRATGAADTDEATGPATAALMIESTAAERTVATTGHVRPGSTQGPARADRPALPPPKSLG